MNINIQHALNCVSVETGIEVRMEGNRLLVADKLVSLPTETQVNDRPRLTGERAELLGIQGLLPTVPHGDDRDKLLWRVIQEAAPESVELLHDIDVLSTLPARLELGSAEASGAAAKALEARFFSARGARRLLPVHASLPLNYQHSSWNASKGPQRIPYTMFGGEIGRAHV